MTTSLGTYKPGERPAPLVIDMNAGDITGYDARANVKRVRGSGAMSRTSITVTDGPNSEVTYTWQDEDFTEPGTWKLEAWVGNGTNRYASVTFVYAVEEAVGDAPDI